jgi:DNA-binding transcriptional LysR family regulator
MHLLHFRAETMRLEWIEDILAVAESGSLIKAAERRCLTQSAFSRRVRMIEDHLGTELFDRSRKPVRLRAVVLDQRLEMLELAARLRRLAFELRHQGQQPQKRIVIASQHTITTAIAPLIVQKIAAAHDVDIRLRSANREECYALLLMRQADIMLFYSTDRQPLAMEKDFVESHAFGTENLIPVFSAARMHDLDAELERHELPVAIYPRSVFFGKVLSEEIWPRLAELSFQPKAESALALALLQFAIIGVAVAWVPETLAAAHILSENLVDLSATLGNQRLNLSAARLKGPRSEFEQEAWDTIVSQRL